MRKPWLWVVGITLVGALARLFILSQRGSLWFDEAFSVHFASMDIPQMLAYLRFENNPPLYFLLLHFWMKIFGNSELAVRALSAIFSVAAIPLLYLIGVRLFNKTAALFASFLLAISSFHVIYATETRMYSLYLFLALLAMWLYLVLESRRAHGAPCAFLRLAFFFVLSLLIWTHITSWLVVAALGVYVLWKSHLSVRQLYDRHRKFLIIVGLLVLQFLPWALHFAKLKIAAPLSHGYIFYIPPDKNFFLTIAEQFLVFAEDNAFVVTLLSVIMVLLIVMAVRTRHQNLPFIFCWLGIPLLIGFAFSNAIPRYFIAVSPAFYLLLGVGFSAAAEQVQRVFGSWQSHIFSGSLAVIFSLIILSDYPATIKLGDDPWDKIAKWVEMRENEECRMKNVECLALVNPHSEVLPLERYYRGTLPVIGFYPKEDGDDRDLRIVKTNWLRLNTKKNISRLADFTNGYDVVFLVTGGLESQGRSLVSTWFWENGWRRDEAQEFGRLSVVRLERQSY